MHYSTSAGYNAGMPAHTLVYFVMFAAFIYISVSPANSEIHRLFSSLSHMFSELEHVLL
jgi:hypothetical protein